MNYLQMINICQDMQDIIQRKYVTNVVHQIILKGIVNGHTHVMIAKKHTKQDQHYADTALTIGPRVHRVTGAEEILQEETDHKEEEEEIIIKGEVEAEDKEVITEDRMDILETTKGIKAISEEITEEMQDKHFMKKEDKTSDNMKMDNLTTVDTQITVDGTVDMTQTGTATMIGMGVRMEMGMQIQ